MKKLIFLFCLISSVVFGQDSLKTETDTTKSLSVSGSVDVYFRQNLNAPNGSNAMAPNTSFGNLNGFSLGMVNIAAEYKYKKAGVVVDVFSGPRAEDATFLSNTLRPDGNSNILNQLYVYYDVNGDLKLTLGKFNTFVGYECIQPTSNFNYTTSYMFSYGPFTHTGVKLDYSKNDFNVLVALMNKTDYTEFNNSNSYTVGGQIGYKEAVYLNVLYGNQGIYSDKTLHLDFVSGFDIGSRFYLGSNVTYNTTDGVGFYGASLYPQIKFSESTTIGFRSEYFSETKFGYGAIGAYDIDGNSSIMENTVTLSYVTGGLTIKPEFRVDSGLDQATFVDNDNNATRNLYSFVISTIYEF